MSERTMCQYTHTVPRRQGLHVGQAHIMLTDWWDALPGAMKVVLLALSTVT